MTPLVSEWGAIDRPLPPPLTSAPEAPYDGMARSIVLGMPQLCLGGLSETWLLKDIGHRHWTLLGYALGQSLPEFEDASGAAVHAAFSAVALRQGDLDFAVGLQRQRLGDQLLFRQVMVDQQ